MRDIQDNAVTMTHIRKLFGLPSCTQVGIMYCPALSILNVDGVPIRFCSKDEQCPKKETNHE